MEELLRKIKGEFELFKMEADKASAGNKSAGVRSRSSSHTLTAYMKMWRKVSVQKGGAK